MPCFVIIALIRELPSINRNAKNVADLIASDPGVAKMDKEAGDINREAAERILKSPELSRMFKKASLDY